MLLGVSTGEGEAVEDTEDDPQRLGRQFFRDWSENRLRGRLCGVSLPRERVWVGDMEGGEW